jgi:hypothetical protein
MEADTIKSTAESHESRTSRADATGRSTVNLSGNERRRGSFIASGLVAALIASACGTAANPSTLPNASAPGPAGGPLPTEITGIFIGATRDVPGVEVDDRLVIDLTDETFRLHTGIGRAALVSAARSVDSGNLRLETVVGSTDCTDGDIGTYPYALSAGGTVLTITSGDDECAPRAEALVGEWRRSDCRPKPGNWCLGELEAGSQTSLFFDPYLEELGPPIARDGVARHGALRYEVPHGWANADDRRYLYTLMRASAYERGDEWSDGTDAISLSANPRANRMDCSEEPDESVGTSAEALAGWIRAHPGLQVSESPAISVDGRQMLVLDIMAPDNYADACVDPEADISFVLLFIHPGYSWGIVTGDRQRLILVEIDTDTAMLIGIDTVDPADIDAFVDEVQPILDTIRLKSEA